MRKSPEIGSGHHTTYFRELDGRMGRWWSADPITFPHQSPYNTFDGNPIYYTDASGASVSYPEKEKEESYKAPVSTEISSTSFARSYVASVARGFDNGGGDPNTGRITAAVYFSFEDPTLTLADKLQYIQNFQASVLATWSNQNINGVAVDLSAVTFLEVDATYDPQNEFHNLFTVGNGAGDPHADGTNTSYVVNGGRAGTTGYFYYQRGNPTNYAAHEFGHIFGLADRYHEGLDNVKHLGLEGWLEGRLTIPMILPKRIDRDYNALDNLYSSATSTLTPMQMEIFFNSRRIERKYPTGVFITPQKGVVKYSALSIGHGQKITGYNSQLTKMQEMPQVVRHGMFGWRYSSITARRSVLAPLLNGKDEAEEFTDNNKKQVRNRLKHAH